MSEESIKNPAGSGNTFAPILISSYTLPYVKFNGNCLISNNVSAFRKVVHFLQNKYKAKTFEHIFHIK